MEELAGAELFGGTELAGAELLGVTGLPGVVLELGDWYGGGAGFEELAGAELEGPTGEPGVEVYGLGVTVLVIWVVTVETVG